LFGAPGARTKISPTTFPCALTARKRPASRQYLLIFNSLKDPNGCRRSNPNRSPRRPQHGARCQGEPPPTPPKMPFELVRPMQQRCKRRAAEGDRPLPRPDCCSSNTGRDQEDQIARSDLLRPTGKTTLSLHLSVMSRRFFDNLRPFTVAQHSCLPCRRSVGMTLGRLSILD